jgi:hypothetical protein
MRQLPRTAGLLVAVLAALSAWRASAASVLDFDVWMRAIDKRSVSVQQRIAAADVAAAADDAREIARLYGLMEDFFVKDGNAADAVALSHDGKVLAASIPAALAAQDYGAAALAARTISHACNDCHDSYKPFK